MNLNHNFKYCWCDCYTLNALSNGYLQRFFVIELTFNEWNKNDPRFYEVKCAEFVLSILQELKAFYTILLISFPSFMALLQCGLSDLACDGHQC